jgi:hypothetical protein
MPTPNESFDPAIVRAIPPPERVPGITPLSHEESALHDETGEQYNEGDTRQFGFGNTSSEWFATWVCAGTAAVLSMVNLEFHMGRLSALLVVACAGVIICLLMDNGKGDKS